VRRSFVGLRDVADLVRPAPSGRDAGAGSHRVPVPCCRAATSTPSGTVHRDGGVGPSNFLAAAGRGQANPVGVGGRRKPARRPVGPRSG
jgi:hypothetical protein